MRGFLQVAGAVSLLSQVTCAIDVNWDNDASVKDAASTIAFGLMKYYTGNNTGDVPGNLPDPYFWWEAGAMFGTMIDYWFLTGDRSYNDVITQAMLHQTGEDRDFMPANQTKTEGNDDQGFWVMAAMTAAENKFPDPPPSEPQWLALAQAAFNEWTMRWDTATCDGGLRWQIFSFNTGFDYKNSISNGCFFNVAARLARFTGNQTYADWAEKVYDWETSVGLIDEEFNVYDGATISSRGDCSKHDRVQWSYNAGIYMHGAAVMYNITESDKWRARVDGMVEDTKGLFFNNSIMFEQACETAGTCNTDQQSFKGYLTRWMAGTTQMAPDTFDEVMPLLRSSAQGAADACSGDPQEGFAGVPGTACGFTWTQGGFDGQVGVGEQMNALSSVMYTLVNRARSPVTSKTGGTSKGDVNAGIDMPTSYPEPAPITTGDRVAAGFLTSAMVLSVLGGSIFAIRD